MWIEVEGIAVYTTRFSENDYELERYRLVGAAGRNGEAEWLLKRQGRTVKEFDTLQQAYQSNEMQTLMPKIAAMIKEHLTKDEAN